MVDELTKYLESRKISGETVRAHVTRAQVILSLKRNWRCNEAAKWISKRAAKKNYTESTINKWHQTFNHLNHCFHWGWSKQLPRLKEHNKTPQMLSLSQLLAFYKLDTTPKWNLIVRLAISTGARPSEILTLKRWEVDTDRGVISLHHTKTDNNRLLIIPEFLLPEVKNYIANYEIQGDQMLFFYKNRYKRLSERSLINEYEKRLSFLKIDKHITPYSMRHAFLTRMASEVNMSLVMELAGHKLTETTLRYIHNNEYALRKATEKDFLFDGMRNLSHRIKKITDLIDELNDCSLNQKKLQQAKVCLLEALE